MTEPMTKANQYRQRAADLRGIASSLPDPKVRAILLETAMHYDFMAEKQERRETPVAERPQVHDGTSDAR